MLVLKAGELVPLVVGPGSGGILLAFPADVPPLLARSRDFWVRVEVFILLLMSLSFPHSGWAPQQWRMEMITVVLIKDVLRRLCFSPG